MEVLQSWAETLGVELPACTPPGQPSPHEAAGTYPPAVGQEDDKAELIAALVTQYHCGSNSCAPS